MRPDDLSKIYVRCADGTMSPVSEFVNLKKIYGQPFAARSMEKDVNLGVALKFGELVKKSLWHWKPIAKSER